MLTLILGRSGTGKTACALHEFSEKIKYNQKNLYYIVPEQYSHDAERQLLKICGDTLNLHGEVLSFSRLASRVFAEKGGLAAKMLDNGGRILLMSRAIDAVSNHLKIYGRSERRADFLENLTALAKEFKSACVTADVLESAASAAEGPLHEKLCDLSLIIGAYNSFFNDDAADPDDRLNRLLRVLPESMMFNKGHVWFDGFTDFTVQELRVVEQLIRMKTDLTVCLTCDGLDNSEEIFDSARKTAVKLRRMASDSGITVSVNNMMQPIPGKDEALIYLEQNLFGSGSDSYAGDNSAIELYTASTPAEECEYAASKVLELVRSGFRWRDISVVVSGFQQIGQMAENIFEKYGIPIYISRKSQVNKKPPLAVIDYALDIITGGWDCESVFRYLKTGMTGIALSDCDELENYALLWNLRGSIWTRDTDWVFPLSGYERDFIGDGDDRLKHINSLRRAVVQPLLKLRKALGASTIYGDKLQALYEFLEGIGLPERITDKALRFEKNGEIQLSEEYNQLWDIITRAFDQFYEISGEGSGSTNEFTRLWKLLITQYDIGTIPVSLDRVGLGELARQRRKDVKCLIVIGASDDALPQPNGGAGILTDSERQEIMRAGVGLSGTPEERLYRSLNEIYLSLTLPTDRLIITHAKRALGGGEKRPSFVIKRLQTLFSIPEYQKQDPDFRLNAPGPCFELAASYQTHARSPAAAAAAAYFSEDPDLSKRLERIAEQAELSRGRLSSGKAHKLYGKELVISASRVDKYYACRYLYFLQYGLKLRPRKPAGFDAPTAGTFMHYILENVTREIHNSGGYAKVDDARCIALTEKYIAEYVKEVLQQFLDKTHRFIYLFNRLKRDAAFIVLDMVHELQNSDFKPIDFELEFSDNGDIPPHVIQSDAQRLKIMGYIDRLDGWEKDGKLYVRVVDYKTGKKKFSLSDVWYGMNMQMLIYLFALSNNAGGRYNAEIVPAGVLYAPARDEIQAASRHVTDAELEVLRAKKLRRSGLLLDDPRVVEAMEHGENKKYLPVKRSKDEGFTGDSLANLERLGMLSAHIDRMLIDIVGNVQGGRIDAEPYYKNQLDNACAFCDYQTACHFNERDGDRRRYLKKLKSDDVWQRINKEAEQ